jgi:hypothetical protein
LAFDRLWQTWDMQETTVHLTDELKQEIERIAAEQGRTEADVILDGIRMLVARHAPPLPSFGFFASGDPDFASKTDELLKGFGKQ